MPYARFDDRYDDHKKVRRALRREPAAVALHAMAITYCNRHISDGIVDVEWVEEKLALTPYKAPQRQRVVEVLVECGLFDVVDDEHFLVHDFLDWNLSRVQREALAEQGRKGGSKPRGKPTGSDGSSQGFTEGSSTPTPTPTPTPTLRRPANSPWDRSMS